MTNSHFMNLSDKAIKSLRKIAPLKKYSTSTPLHYQGQVPIVAYLILKGNILLLKNSKMFHKLTKGYLVGYRELFLNAPSTFTANALNDTEVCYIDKSTLLEIKSSQSEDMRQLYSELENIIL